MRHKKVHHLVKVHRHVRVVKTKHGKKKTSVDPQIRRIHQVVLVHGKHNNYQSLTGSLEELSKGLFGGLHEGQEAVVVIGKGVTKGIRHIGKGGVEVVADVGDTAVGTFGDLSEAGLSGGKHIAEGGIDIVRHTGRAVKELPKKSHR